ncbi:MAG: UvrD-helicase domain-containing protein, partial [Nannocystaceae bacterium]
MFNVINGDSDTVQYLIDDVRAALSGFDRASISTIHSFSQRMLDQFAFESGQEAELELVADATELAEEYVADLMANAYAGATERELGALEDLGFNPKRVRTLVKEMTRAVTPELRPDPATLQGLPSTPLAIARRWCKEVDSVGAFVGSEEGEAALTGIGSLRGKKGKKLTASQAKKAEEAAESLREWVADGGRKASIGTSAEEEYLRGKRATSAEEDPEYARVAPLFDKVNGALTLRERLDAAMAVYVAEHARRHLETELERRRWLTFNAILSRLAARISDPDSGSELAAAIRDRYEVALVDEFQDTDSAQWAVLKAVFANVSRRLILIGDPKQAIYAFRDADIYVYLQAKGETKARRETMTTNYRTDRSLVQAMNHLWQEGSGAFMTDAIEYVEVEANHGDGRARLPDLPCGRSRAPLELRWANVHTLRGEHPREGEERIDTDEGRQLAGYLCAREAAALLRTGHRFFPEKSGDER